MRQKIVALLMKKLIMLLHIKRTNYISFGYLWNHDEVLWFGNWNKRKEKRKDKIIGDIVRIKKGQIYNRKNLTLKSAFFIIKNKL